MAEAKTIQVETDYMGKMGIGVSVHTRQAFQATIRA